MTTPLSQDEWEHPIAGVVFEGYPHKRSHPPDNHDIRVRRGVHGTHHTVRSAWNGTHANAERLLIRFNDTAYRILATPPGRFSTGSYWIGPIFRTYDHAKVAWDLL